MFVFFFKKLIKVSLWVIFVSMKVQLLYVCRISFPIHEGANIPFLQNRLQLTWKYILQCLEFSFNLRIR